MEAEVIEREDQIGGLVSTTQGEVKALRIVDDESLQAAVDLGGRIKTRARAIEAWFKPLVDAAFAAHRKLTKARDEALAPFKTAEADIKRAALAYTTEKERQRQAEAKRLEDEARARKQKEADDAAAFEGPEAAAAVESAPPEAVVPPPAVEKPKGVAMTKNWKFEVVDPNLVPRAYLIVDEKKLGQYAKAMKEGASVPGVRFWAEDGMALRAQ